MKFLLAAVIASCTVNAVHFNCNFAACDFEGLRSYYTCQPTVTLTASTTLEKQTGGHDWFHSNDNVDGLVIIKQNLPFFPQGIGNFFRYLKALDFSTTNLNSISANDLKPFPELAWLKLYESNLTSLDGDLFKFTPLLKFLSLKNNKIQHIGPDLLTKLNNLVAVYLQGNDCIDRYANSRESVTQLATQLTALCQFQDLTIIESTTLMSATETPIERCSCTDEITELRTENQRQDEKILQQSGKIEKHNKAIQEQNEEIKQQNKEIQEQRFNIDQLQQSNDHLTQLYAQLQQSYAKLQQSNDKVIKSNEQLLELKTAIEDRLLQVETKQREILSVPCSN